MFRDTINKEINLKSISIYKLAKDSGLQQTQLKKYLDKKTDLQGENIEKIFNVLNIKLKK